MLGRFKWAHNPIYLIFSISFSLSLGRRQSGLCKQKIINQRTGKQTKKMRKWRERETKWYNCGPLFIASSSRFLFLPPYSFNWLPWDIIYSTELCMEIETLFGINENNLERFFCYFFRFFIFLFVDIAEIREENLLLN